MEEVEITNWLGRRDCYDPQLAVSTLSPFKPPREVMMRKMDRIRSLVGHVHPHPMIISQTAEEDPSAAPVERLMS